MSQVTSKIKGKFFSLLSRYSSGKRGEETAFQSRQVLKVHAVFSGALFYNLLLTILCF